MDGDTHATPSLPRETFRLPAGEGVLPPATDIRSLPGPPGHWLLGNARQIQPERLHATLEGWVEQYGPFLKFRIGRTAYVVLSDATLINGILRSRPDTFARGSRLSRLIDETGPTGLFTAEGDHWRRQRKLLMRALKPEAVRGFFPHIEQATARLQQRWSNAADAGTVCDVGHDLKCLAVDIAAGLAIGEDVNTLQHEDDPFQTDIEFWFGLIGHRLASPIPYWRWFNLAPERRLLELQSRRDQLIERVIRQARECLRTDPDRREHPANILQALVTARDAPDSEFTDEDVRGNILTLIFAGEDTAANAIAWLMLDLSTDRPLAQSVRNEVDEALDAGHATRLDQLRSLGRLESVAMESMRIRPVAPILGVTALKPVDLAGLRIEAGQTLMLATRSASRRSGSFMPFDKIDPERLAPSGQGQGQPTVDPRHDTFIFGGGPRTCPGRYLAMVEMKMVVSMALRSFEFEVAGDPEDSRERFTFTMGPKRLLMRFSRR